MEDPTSHVFKFIVKNTQGEEKAITVVSDEHIDLLPGEIININQEDESVAQLVPLFQQESLAVVYEDGTAVILDNFFTKTGEGVPMPAIQFNDGTYYAPDFTDGLSTNFQKNSFIKTAFSTQENHIQNITAVDEKGSSSATEEYKYHDHDQNNQHLFRFAQHHDHGSHYDSNHASITEPSNPATPGHAEFDPYLNPKANDLSINMYKSQVIQFIDPEKGLLHYDEVSPGEKIKVSQSDSTTSLGVHIAVHEDGTFSYDPTELKSIYSLDDGQAINDQFQYTVTDSRGNSSTATVFITINGAHDRIVLGTNGNDNSLDGQGSGDLKGGFGNNVIIGDPGGVFYVHDHPVLNVCLALDVSSRMDEFINPYITKLDLMKASVMELIDGYDNLAKKGAIINFNIIPITDVEHTQSIGCFTLNGDPHDDLHSLQGMVAGLESHGDGASYTEALYQTQEWLQTLNDYKNTHNSVFFISEGTPSGSANPHYFFPDDLPELQKNGEPLQFKFEIGKGTWNDLMQNTELHAVVVGEHSPNSNLSLLTDDHHSPAVLVETNDSAKLVTFIPDTPFYSPEILYGGNDVIHGGLGSNLIFGDVPNTDNLSSPHFGGAGTHNGAGYAVISDKFDGNTKAIVDYLMDPTDHYANARALADSEHGGNDTIYGGIGHNIIFGEGGNNLIYGGGAGDFIVTGNGNNIIHAGNGHNYIDAGEGQNQIFGGTGDDTIVFHAGNFTLGSGSVDGGGGINTLLFTGHDQSFDLTQEHNPLHNFSHIDLKGDSDNSHNQLTLDLKDVFDISGNEHSLFVEGNASNQVNAIGNWNMVGTEAINDHLYNHYAAQMSNLYVENTIQVQMQQQQTAIVA